MVAPKVWKVHIFTDRGVRAKDGWEPASFLIGGRQSPVS
jgi:hypothetical protein